MSGVLVRLSSVSNDSSPPPSPQRAQHAARRGVLTPPIDQLTDDGYDLQFGTTVVGHFYFTELLMPTLFAGAQTSPDHHARVVTTASMAAYMQTLEYDTFRDGPARRALGTVKLYNQSKHVSIPIILPCFCFCTCFSVPGPGRPRSCVPSPCIS